MREGKNRLRIGALLLGVGLAFGLAAPTLAEETASAETPDGSLLAVADTEQSFIAVPDTRTDQEVFTADLLDCIADIGVSDSITGVMENVLDEESTTEEDNTPYNPIDDDGSLVDERDFDCEAQPPL